MSKLPEAVQKKIRQKLIDIGSFCFGAVAIRHGIGQIALEGYEQFPYQFKPRIDWVYHSYFEKRISVREIGSGSNDWIQSLLKSLEYIALESKINQWAENDEFKKEAASRIMDFIKNPAQKNLDLSRLNLYSLPDIFDCAKMTCELECLNLSKNQLQDFPYSFSKLRNLNNLDLSFNQIRSLPIEKMQNLKNLEKLNLTSNQIQSIPKAITGICKLKVLELSKNRIQSLPDSFAGLVDLSELYLTGNLFSSIPNFICSMTNLKVLYFNQNQLQSIPESIGDLAGLHNLNLSENQLRVLPDSIGSLHDLQFFNLQKNRLQSLPDNIGFLTKLFNLDLSGNQLQFLPNSILNLSSYLTVSLINSGLSFAVLERLREQLNDRGHLAPRITFSLNDRSRFQESQTVDKSLVLLYKNADEKGFVNFEITYPNIYRYVRINRKLNPIQDWLSRLSYMQPSRQEGSEGLSKKILSYLQLAENNEDFRWKLFVTIEGAAETCGDRIALSVLELGIQQRMMLIDKNDLPRFAEFLIHGPWMLDRLQEIARQKIESLRFVDEIEVYLGYPVKLRERLDLQIDVENMLYFACSGITPEDLNVAENRIQQMLMSPDAKANILIQREDWISSLTIKYPKQVNDIITCRKESYEALMKSSKAITSQEEIEIKEKYESALLELTKTALLS